MDCTLYRDTNDAQLYFWTGLKTMHWEKASSVVESKVLIVFSIFHEYSYFMNISLAGKGRRSLVPMARGNIS